MTKPAPALFRRIPEKVEAWIRFWCVGLLTFGMVMVVMFVVLLVGMKACAQVISDLFRRE